MSSKWKLWLGRLLALFIVTSGARWLMAAPEAQSLNRLEQLMLVFFGSGILFLFFLRVRWTMFFFTSSALIALVLKSDLRYSLLPQEDRPLASLTIQYFDFGAEARPAWKRHLMHAPGELVWVQLPDTTACPDDLQMWQHTWQQVWCLPDSAGHALLSQLPCCERASALPSGFHEKTCLLRPHLPLHLVVGRWQPALSDASLEAVLRALAARPEPTVLLLLTRWHLLGERLKDLAHAQGLAICQLSHPPFQPSRRQWQALRHTSTLFVIHNAYLCCRQYHLSDPEGQHCRTRLSVFASPQSHCHETTH